MLTFNSIAMMLPVEEKQIKPAFATLYQYQITHLGIDGSTVLYFE